MALHEDIDHTGLPGVGGGGATFKRTVLDGNGNKTTTSATKVAIDSTNLAYLTLDLQVGEVVRCTLAAHYFNSAANATGFDFEVDRPTSGDTFVGAGADYGCTAWGGGTSQERVPITVVGLFTATEAGVHGFRPAWLTDGGTATLANASSGNSDTLIAFMVEKLGTPTP